MKFSRVWILLFAISIVKAAPDWQYPQVGFDSKPSYLDPKDIVLTFDDGPSWNSATVDVLNLLQQRGIKAAFFLNTMQASACDWTMPSTTEAVRRIIEEGHEIASHTRSHPHLPTLTAEQIQSEIYGVESEIKQYLPNVNVPKITLFRAPYGEPYQWKFQGDPQGDATYPTIAGIAAPSFVHIGWNFDSNDWECADDAPTGGPCLVNSFKTLLQNGEYGIVLMHSISARTAAALPQILDYIDQNGYHLRSVEYVVQRVYGMTSAQIVSGATTGRSTSSTSARTTTTKAVTSTTSARPTTTTTGSTTSARSTTPYTGTTTTQRPTTSGSTTTSTSGATTTTTAATSSSATTTTTTSTAQATTTTPATTKTTTTAATSSSTTPATTTTKTTTTTAATTTAATTTAATTTAATTTAATTTTAKTTTAATTTAKTTTAASSTAAAAATTAATTTEPTTTRATTTAATSTPADVTTTEATTPSATTTTSDATTSATSKTDSTTEDQQEPTCRTITPHLAGCRTSNVFTISTDLNIGCRTLRISALSSQNNNFVNFTIINMLSSYMFTFSPEYEGKYKVEALCDNSTRVIPVCTNLWASNPSSSIRVRFSSTPPAAGSDRDNFLRKFARGCASAARLSIYQICNLILRETTSAGRRSDSTTSTFSVEFSLLSASENTTSTSAVSAVMAAAATPDFNRELKSELGPDFVARSVATEGHSDMTPPLDDGGNPDINGASSLSFSASLGVLFALCCIQLLFLHY